MKLTSFLRTNLSRYIQTSWIVSTAKTLLDDMIYCYLKPPKQTFSISIQLAVFKYNYFEWANSTLFQKISEYVENKKNLFARWHQKLLLPCPVTVQKICKRTAIWMCAVMKSVPRYKLRPWGNKSEENAKIHIEKKFRISILRLGKQR